MKLLLYEENHELKLAVSGRTSEHGRYQKTDRHMSKFRHRNY